MDITIKEVKKYLNDLAQHLENKGNHTLKIDTIGKGFSACCFYNSNLLYDYLMKLEFMEETGQILDFEQERLKNLLNKEDN